MDERLKFVARPLDGLSDRSRRSYWQADQLPFQRRNPLRMILVKATRDIDEAAYLTFVLKVNLPDG